MEVTTVAVNGRHEFTEKKSVFISRAFFVTTEEEAMKALDEVRAEHPEAKHHVWAYALHTGGACRFSDAGEPAGTAGQPILKTMELSGVRDVCIVVTRYFGGILLGAGGLARAYTRAAAGALDASGKAKLIDVLTFTVRCPYELHRAAARSLADMGAEVTETAFDDAVTMSCTVPEDAFGALKARLDETFYTRITLTRGASRFDRRPV